MAENSKSNCQMCGQKECFMMGTEDLCLGCHDTLMLACAEHPESVVKSIGKTLRELNSIIREKGR